MKFDSKWINWNVFGNAVCKMEAILFKSHYVNMKWSHFEPSNALSIPKSLGQHHGCWCPGSLCPQAISCHGIDNAVCRGLFFPYRMISSTCIVYMFPTDAKSTYGFVFPEHNSTCNGLKHECMSDIQCSKPHDALILEHPWASGLDSGFQSLLSIQRG